MQSIPSIGTIQSRRTASQRRAGCIQLIADARDGPRRRVFPLRHVSAMPAAVPPEDDDASIPYPQLWRAARRRYRHHRPPFGLVSIASAIMAGCCSSTCATITASPRWSPTRIRLRSGRLKSCAPNGSSGSTGGCARARPAPENPGPADRRGRGVRASTSRCWAGPANCRCRCSATRNIRKTSGSNTASSICGASGCTATS